MNIENTSLRNIIFASAVIIALIVCLGCWLLKPIAIVTIAVFVAVVLFRLSDISRDEEQNIKLPSFGATTEAILLAMAVAGFVLFFYSLNR